MQGDHCVEVMTDGEAGANFDAVRPYLERAAEFAPYDRIDWEQQRAKVARGDALLVEITHGGERVAVAFLEMVRGREGDCLSVRWLSGAGMGGWLALLWSGLQDIARAYGCKYVAVTGRPGWSRALRGLGFRDLFRIVQAEV